MKFRLFRQNVAFYLGVSGSSIALSDIGCQITGTFSSLKDSWVYREKTLVVSTEVRVGESS